MIQLDNRIKAFIELGDLMTKICSQDFETKNMDTKYLVQSSVLSNLISDSYHYNGWFTENMVRYMFQSIGESLSSKSLNKWVGRYKAEFEATSDPKTVGVVMAGNVPLVGFHDFLTVLLSGNYLKARLSSDDDKLLPALAELLTLIEPGFKNRIEFTNSKLENFDVIIATGSNNTARYFEYYFGKYPNIIRKNRNGVAVVTGLESQDELKSLSDDIFLYYGLGCRNVSKLYVPEDYNFNSLLEILADRKEIAVNHKYFNNYEYNKAIYLVNSTSHLDTGNVLFVENSNTASPVSVLYYEYYKALADVKTGLESNRENIQCIVGVVSDIDGIVPPGKSQQPALWDYADGVDTMKFILTLD